jgi:hypothetical protein
MLCRYDEYHYAECHYVECRYAECRGAKRSPWSDVPGLCEPRSSVVRPQLVAEPENVFNQSNFRRFADSGKWNRTFFKFLNYIDIEIQYTYNANGC